MQIDQKFEIDPFEWNFQECPKDQLSDCLLYELARECKLLRDAKTLVEGRNFSPQPFPVIPGFIDYEFSTPFQRSLYYSNSFLISYFAEWPEKPWLAISEEKREKYYAEAKTKNWMPLFATARDVTDSAGVQPNVTLVEEDHKVTYVALKIDWRKSDDDLKKLFDNWLKFWRPEDAKPIEFRGRSSAPDTLKKIAAYRLLKVLHYTQAIDITNSVLESRYGKFKPLYLNQAAWIRASAQGQRAIEAFEHTGSVQLAIKAASSKK